MDPHNAYSEQQRRELEVANEVLEEEQSVSDASNADWDDEERQLDAHNARWALIAAVKGLTGEVVAAFCEELPPAKACATAAGSHSLAGNVCAAENWQDQVSYCLRHAHHINKVKKDVGDCVRQPEIGSTCPFP